MWLKTRKIIVLFLISIILVIINSHIIYAKQILSDFNRNECSLTIIPTSVNTHKTIKSTQFSAWQVGTLEIKEGIVRYVLTEEFESVDVDLNDLNFEESLKQLQNYAENNDIKKITRKANEDGKVQFRNIPAGLYLLKQDDIKQGTEGVSSFLVAVPIEDSNGEGWKYHVDAHPKAGNIGGTEIKPYPNTDKLLPQTGQLNWPIPILASVGMIFFILGYEIYKKKR